jgi:uncharacterized membrane protein YeaQ/YmgE (transglycosylase-associated protein family)
VVFVALNRTGIPAGWAAGAGAVPAAPGTVIAVACVGLAGPLFQRIEEHPMINFVIWLAVGGLVGWLASVVMQSQRQHGLALNVVVGVVGAAVGGWIISPMVGVETPNEDVFNVGALLVSLIAAIGLLALINLVRRDSVS